jgi:hypothetical protein
LIDTALDISMDYHDAGRHQSHGDDGKRDKTGRVPSAAEASQPTKLMSVTTIIPCHNLR